MIALSAEMLHLYKSRCNKRCNKKSPRFRGFPLIVTPLHLLPKKIGYMCEAHTHRRRKREKRVYTYRGYQKRCNRCTGVTRARKALNMGVFVLHLMLHLPKKGVTCV